MNNDNRVRTKVSSAAMLCASLLLLGALPTASGKSAKPAPAVTLSGTLNRDPNESRGKQIYDRNCAACHQADGFGRPEQNIPALAGQQYEYLVKQLVDFLDEERGSDTMRQQVEHAGLDNATAIADVVGYVANLPMNPQPSRGNGQNLAQGRKIYDGYCASCHGKTAEGNGDLWVPNLRGQHYGYLVQQMQRMAQAQRGNISDDLHRIFTTYAVEEFEAVGDYLTRWTDQSPAER